MRKLIIILMILVFSGSSAFAEIYSWTDEKGVKHYSSTPPDNQSNYQKSSEVPYNAQEDEAQSQAYQQWLEQKRQEEAEKTLEKQKQTEEKQKEEEKARAEAEKAKLEAEKAQEEAEKARIEENKKKRRRNF
jgi:hypothetical protein